VTPWLSAVIVAVAVMAIGYALTMSGIGKMRATSFAPTQTMESLKETATWTTRTRA
jgi:hypothetical protein